MAGIAGDVDAGWSGVGLSDGRGPVAPGAIATGCVVVPGANVSVPVAAA